MATEKYTCYVSQIRDGVAYIDVYRGDSLDFYGEIEAEKLKEHEIGEKDRFEIEATPTETKFKKIPRTPLSTQQVTEINDRIQRQLDDTFPDSHTWVDDTI